MGKKKIYLFICPFLLLIHLYFSYFITFFFFFFYFSDHSNLSLSLSPATASCRPSQVPALQESQIKRNAVLFHELESQDGFLDIIGDNIAVEDGSEGGEGEQVLSFHEFDCHTPVNEQVGFPTIVNDEIYSMKIYDMQSSRFSLSSHGGQGH